MSKPNPFANLNELRAHSDADKNEFLRLVQKTQERLPGKRRRERFVQVPIKAAARVAKVAQEPRTFIWLWILYLRWKTGSKTVSLSNVGLREWGIGRETKRRAVAALEHASLLRVERHCGRSVRVTLLD